jgi:hypothetical protein
VDVSVTLPPGDTMELSRPEVVDLVRNAALALLARGAMTEVTTYSRRVVRPADEGVSSVYVQFPKYWPAFPGEQVRCELSAAAPRALADHLWEHGCEKMELSGPAPGRSDWELFLLMRVALPPLISALERSAIQEAIETGQVRPWRLLDRFLGEAVEATTDEILERSKPQEHRRSLVRAFCPLLMPGTLPAPIRLAEGLDLAPWTPLLASEVLTLHEVFLDVGDAWFCPPIASAVLRCECMMLVARKDANQKSLDALKAVCDRIDLAKWALTLASPNLATPAEGPIICEDRSRRCIIKHRREGLKFSFPAPSVESLDLASCAKAVQEFQEQSQRVRELAYALWHFGRACLAGLPGDGILEAAMGLDSLLTSSGDAGYRFKLHGAVMLAGPESDPEELARRFSSLWNLRSRLAHGQYLDVADDDWDGARKLLAQTIKAVVTKMGSGTLLSSRRDFSLSGAVERYVLFHASSHGN